MITASPTTLQILGTLGLIALCVFLAKLIFSSSGSGPRKIAGIAFTVFVVTFIGGEAVASEAYSECVGSDAPGADAVEQITPSLDCRAANARLGDQWRKTLGVLLGASSIFGIVLAKRERDRTIS